jgi:predicted nuclease of predicted toxin-antitoxin system
MKFLADMGLSGLTVNWLRQRGHEALHLRDLLAVSGARLPSVVLFRLEDESAETVNARLTEVLAQCADALATGAIVSVSDNAIRVRTLPIE